MIASAPAHDPRSAAVFAALALALWFKGLLVSWVQVRARFRARAFARPEDAHMLGLDAREEPALVVRAGDAWRNETENGPFFMAIAAAAVLVGAPFLVLAASAAAFVAARLVHAWAQIAALQPLRTISWLAGVPETPRVCRRAFHTLGWRSGLCRLGGLWSLQPPPICRTHIRRISMGSVSTL